MSKEFEVPRGRALYSPRGPSPLRGDLGDKYGLVGDAGRIGSFRGATSCLAYRSGPGGAVEFDVDRGHLKQDDRPERVDAQDRERTSVESTLAHRVLSKGVLLHSLC